MSLQRAAMQARIAQLPRDLPPLAPPDDPDAIEDDEEGEVDDLGPMKAPSALSTASGSTSMPRRGKKSALDLSPLSASTHFAQAVQVAVQDADLDVRLYLTPPAPSDNTAGSVMVFHHGAGYSALSFAVLATAITQSTSGECGVLAFDARAHGACVWLLELCLRCNY